MAAYVKITDAEFEALYGLPVMAQLLYLYLLRRMDFSTGLVGSPPFDVSWWALREDMHVAHGQGRSRNGSGTPTEKAVRYAADMLERAGLLVNKSRPRQLIFLLPLAALGEVRSKEVGQTYGRQVGQTYGRQVGQTEGLVTQGESVEVGQTIPREVGQTIPREVGHTSRVTVLSSSIPRSSSVGLEEQPVDAAADLSDLPNPPTEPGHWLAWFNRVHGTEYSPTNVHDRKAIWPVLQRWVKAGLTVEQMHAAVERAYATASGPIGNLAVYCDRVLTTMQAEAAGKGAGRKQTYQALTGGSSGGVIDATAIRVD